MSSKVISTIIKIFQYYIYMSLIDIDKLFNDVLNNPTTVKYINDYCIFLYKNNHNIELIKYFFEQKFLLRLNKFLNYRLLFENMDIECKLYVINNYYSTFLYTTNTFIFKLDYYTYMPIFNVDLLRDLIIFVMNHYSIKYVIDNINVDIDNHFILRHLMNDHIKNKSKIKILLKCGLYKDHKQQIKQYIKYKTSNSNININIIKFNIYWAMEFDDLEYFKLHIHLFNIDDFIHHITLFNFIFKYKKIIEYLYGLYDKQILENALKKNTPLIELLILK